MNNLGLDSYTRNGLSRLPDQMCYDAKLPQQLSVRSDVFLPYTGEVAYEKRGHIRHPPHWITVAQHKKSRVYPSHPRKRYSSTTLHECAEAYNTCLQQLFEFPQAITLYHKRSLLRLTVKVCGRSDDFIHGISSIRMVTSLNDSQQCEIVPGHRMLMRGQQIISHISWSESEWSHTAIWASSKPLILKNVFCIKNEQQSFGCIMGNQ